MDTVELQPHAHEITDWDQQVYGQLVSVDLTPQQIEHLRMGVCNIECLRGGI